MEGSYPSRLRVWEGPTGTAIQDLLRLTVASPVPAGGPAAGSIRSPEEAAQQLFASEALLSSVALARLREETEPYTLQWFLSIENQRHGRQGRWIPRLLEFSKHAGETLLGLGYGLGTDWLQYARHGASVVVCTPSASQLALIRRNFELRGLSGRFFHAPPAALPLENASIDVVCVSDLLQVVEQRGAVIDEVFRVLKPGGKVLAVTPARYDVDFWMRTWFFWERWFRRRPDSTAVRFSVRGLRRLFGRFIEHRIHKRQLRRTEVPHLWRVLPLPVLERLMGRVLVLKAFKPLSTAMHVQAAA